MGSAGAAIISKARSLTSALIIGYLNWQSADRFGGLNEGRKLTLTHLPCARSFWRGGVIILDDTNISALLIIDRLPTDRLSRKVQLSTEWTPTGTIGDPEVSRFYNPV